MFWKKVVDVLNGVLGEMFGKVYVKDNFLFEVKVCMEELVDNVIRGYVVVIENFEWMSLEIKIVVKEKFDKFMLKIGYLDKWKDYLVFEVKSDDLVGNYICYSEWEYVDMIVKLGKLVDCFEWYMIL